MAAYGGKQPDKLQFLVAFSWTKGYNERKKKKGGLILYSDVFCRVYNELGWNAYPEVFGERLLQWLRQKGLRPKNSLDLGCGTGVLCRVLQEAGIEARGMDLSAGMIAIARKESPRIPYDVADMVSYCPARQFDLVTCTGDALNHIHDLKDVERIFQNVYRYTSPGGCFIFDILRREEATAGEPFEVDFEQNLRIWFRLTQPEPEQIALTVRLFDSGLLQFEEVIREKVHDHLTICELLQKAGFTVESCADRLLPEHNRSTTWYVVARKV